jgi:hypothetical protein
MWGRRDEDDVDFEYFHWISGKLAGSASCFSLRITSENRRFHQHVKNSPAHLADGFRSSSVKKKSDVSCGGLGQSGNGVRVVDIEVVTLGWLVGVVATRGISHIIQTVMRGTVNLNLKSRFRCWTGRRALWSDSSTSAGWHGYLVRAVR